jgi:hypothetical protein
MRNRSRKNVELVRQSETWYQTDETRNHPALNSLPNYEESHYTRMLIEDVSNGAMPYSGSKWSVNARLDPSESEIEELVEEAISRNDYRRNFYEVIAEFAQECAAWMMTYGKAVYEIAYMYEDDNKPVAFTLFSVIPNSIKAEKGKLKQYVPGSVVRESELPSDVIELTPENFITFELPPYMRSEYTPMMDALYAQGSLTSMPDFVLSSMKGEIHPVPYDLKKFSRDQKMAVAEATKLIGWNARQAPNDEFKTEYYDLHRFLRFERFKLEVRNSILLTLNQAIARAGKKLGFECQIKVEGLPTLTDVQDAHKALAQGSKKFIDVINPFLAYS